MTDIKTLEQEIDRILKSNAAVQVFYDRDSMEDYDKLVPEIMKALNLYIEEKIKEQFVDKVKPYASKKSKEAFVSGYLQGFRDCNLGRDNKYEHEE